MDISADQIKLLLETGKTLVEPIRRDNGDIVVPVPEGVTLQTLPKVLPQKEFISQTVDVDTDESFIRYVDAFKIIDRSMIFGRTGQSGAVIAVLDYHSGEPGPSGVGRGEHKVRYEFEPSPSFLVWSMINNKLLGQDAFAEFLEEHGADVISPDAATLAELVNDLSVTRVSSIKSKINLSNGCTQLTCLEEDSPSSNGKNIVVPKAVVIRIPLFEGGETFDLPLLFRYRITNSKLSFEVKFHRLEPIVLAATREKIEALATKTNLPLIYGGIR